MAGRRHPGAPGEEGRRRKKLTALLDFQSAEVRYEGEEPPQADPLDTVAIRCWNLLADGQGGLNWAGLELVAAWLGVDDLDGLLQRLQVIKLHKPPGAQAPGGHENDERTLGS